MPSAVTGHTYLCNSKYECSQLLVVLEARPALWAILPLHLLELRECCTHQLKDDGGIDVGDDTQAEQTNLQQQQQRQGTPSLSKELGTP